MKLHKYPTEVEDTKYGWCFYRGYETEDRSLEGIHLATLYGQLISHLSSSRLEPPNAYPYTAKLLSFRKSSLRRANDENL